jgi:hypothetical protein
MFPQVLDLGAAYARDGHDIKKLIRDKRTIRDMLLGMQKANKRFT